MNYETFLQSKLVSQRPAGIEPAPVHPMLFPFQADIVRWALRLGRACVFADCGMGKTFIQLEWSRQIPGDVLILAPLAVAQQTVEEGRRLGLEVDYCRSGESVSSGITIANYEMLHHFDPSRFTGIVLDESSIIKHFEGKTRTAILGAFSETPYRLACTATPAPNDFMELGNHAEFVGSMSRTEMLSMFFVHDGGETSKWRLKGHAETDFWKWICSWAVMLRKPSDLGYDDAHFILPALRVEQITVEHKRTTEFLFELEAQTLQERLTARRESVGLRVAKCAEIVLASLSRSPKLATWKNSPERSDSIESTESSGSEKRANIKPITAKNEKHTCSNTTKRSPRNLSDPKSSKTPTTQDDEKNTRQILTTPRNAEKSPKDATRQQNETDDCDQPSGSAQRSMMRSLHARAEDAPYAGKPKETQEGTDSQSITAITQSAFADCSAQTAISELESLEMILRSSSGQANILEPWLIWCNLNAEQDELEDQFGDLCISITGSMSPEEKLQRLTSWLRGNRPICISKPSIIGFGINAQHCSRVAFVGLSDSWEQYYQAVRRCWRFGQEKNVKVYIITAQSEGAVVTNIKRKEQEASRLSEEMVKHMHSMNEQSLKGVQQKQDTYKEAVAEGGNWKLYLGDCVDVFREIESDSIGFSIFSPPFASLYTYSASSRDMGNSKTYDQFSVHFGYLVEHLFRVMLPGRLVSFHCMNLPTSKTHHGYIGLQDFRGHLIRAFEERGFIFHSEVCIWKDPVTAMQRTKAIGLLHKQMVKDSCMSRQGVPDFLVTMRKPGENQKPVSGELGKWVGDASFRSTGRLSIDLWQRYASPVWMDINPSRTLQKESAREEKDERHICPLQLDVIERAMMLWSNPGDLVASPFAGIGSEGYVALQMGRRFVGAELKESYWKQAALNLRRAETEAQDDLFHADAASITA